MATEAGGIYIYQRTLLIRFKEQFPLHRSRIAGQTPNTLLSLGTSNAFRVMNSESGTKEANGIARSVTCLVDRFIFTSSLNESASVSRADPVIASCTDVSITFDRYCSSNAAQQRTLE
jgi:hypothetical protein